MKVFLRPITLEDGSYIVKWRNDTKIKNHCFQKTDVTIESNKKFFEENVLTGKYKQYMVIRVDDDFGVVSYPIATVYLKDIDYNNRKCELCIFTSDDQEWNTESQAMAIRQLLDVAFSECKVNKVYSYVFCNNHDEVNLMLNSGFYVEARLEKEAVDTNGDYVDAYRMAVFKK